MEKQSKFRINVKRALFVLMALIFALSVTACDGGKVTIELTEDNYYYYFVRDVSVSDLKTESKYFPAVEAYGYYDSGTATVSVNIYKKVDFEIKNVSFILSLKLSSDKDEGWSTPSKYVDLPLDGNYSTTFNVDCNDTEQLLYSEPHYMANWENIKGSIVVSKDVAKEVEEQMKKDGKYKGN